MRDLCCRVRIFCRSRAAAIRYGWLDAWLSLTDPERHGAELWAWETQPHWHPRVQRVMEQWDADYERYVSDCTRWALD